MAFLGRLIPELVQRLGRLPAAQAHDPATDRFLLFDLDLLATVTNRDSDRVLELLDAALRADRVRDEASRPGALSFSHTLIEHTLYESLGPTRQQRVHLRVATALEDRCGDEPGDRIGELAYHWARTGRQASTSKAIEYAMRAGEHALVKLAPDAAIQWYGQALELLDSQPSANGFLRCEVLIGLGTAQTRAIGSAHRPSWRLPG